jgi:hypothetical protein
MQIEHVHSGWWRWRYMIIEQVLLYAAVMYGSDTRAVCDLDKASILSRSPQGLVQVSNLGSIQIRCRVPQRPFPTKPGEGRYGLRAETTAYEVLANRTKKLVPSGVDVVGGGFGPEPEPEWVDFYVKIPLESRELDSEANRYLAKLEQSLTPEQKQQFAWVAHKDEAREKFRRLVNQHRVGHFQVECRVLDGARVIGIGAIEFEILFKGRFSDMLPGSPPV